MVDKRPESHACTVKRHTLTEVSVSANGKARREVLLE